LPQELVCVAASQRSGTNALRDILTRTMGMRNFGEILHHDSQFGTQFVDFAREENISFVDLASRLNAKKVMLRFHTWLKSKAGSQHILIDIKHNSWSTLPDPWRYAFQEPLFLRFLRGQKAIFIFISREDLADQVMSLLVAHRLGIWHNLSSEKVAGRTFALPLDAVRAEATNIRRGEALVLQHLEKCSRKIVTTYEALFVDGKLSDGFKADFCKLGDFKIGAPMAGNIEVNTADKREIVTNYDEVVRAIRQIDDRFKKKQETGKK
jgi:hypothetical protein